MANFHLKFVFVLFILCVFTSITFSKNACCSTSTCQGKNITCIKEGLQQVPRLPNSVIYLNLGINNIADIKHQEFQQCAELRELVLLNNKITRLKPEVFSTLRHLNKLYLNSNLIKKIDVSAFYNLRNLKVLNLAFNDIKELSPKLFIYMPNLQKVSLNDNKLQTLASGVFEGLRHLEQLYLQNNNIESISYGVFDELKELKILLLNNNSIHIVPSNMIQGSPWLQEINLSDNPLDCERVKEFLYMVHYRHGLFYYGPCHERPTIQTAATIVAKHEGEVASFLCSATGEPKPEIEWLRYSRRMPNNRGKCLVEDGALTIQNVTESDAGKYTCKAINSWGEARQEVFLNVITEVLISDNQNLILNCYDEETNDIGSAFTWYKNGNKIFQDKKIVFVDNNRKLQILNGDSNDTGYYTCVNNHNKKPLRAFHIKYYMKTEDANFEARPINAYVGMSIKIPCGLINRHKNFIKWTKNGKDIRNGRITEDRVTGELSIMGISLEDAGMYQCKFLNKNNKDTKSITLRVFSSYNIYRALPKAEIDFENAIKCNLNDYFKINSLRRQKVRGAEIYGRTLEYITKFTNNTQKFNLSEILTDKELAEIALQSGTLEQLKPEKCTDICYHYRYRTITGNCNNIEHPDWGSALIQYRRLLPAYYENDVSQPVGLDKLVYYNGQSIPSASEISEVVTETRFLMNKETNFVINQMAVLWGMWLDHDINYIVPPINIQAADGPNSKTAPNDRSQILPNPCVAFTRSSAFCSFTTTPNICIRQQINQQTSFIDASHVYGYDSQVAENLRNRTADSGGLRYRRNSKNNYLLPIANNSECGLNDEIHTCFDLGDKRGNGHIALIVMHTIWLREHNRIAAVLKEINPFWDGDKIYQETKKIVGAQMQFITYEHWLRHILSPEDYEDLDHYDKYNPIVDSSLSNVFGTAASQFWDIFIDLMPNLYDRNAKNIAISDEKDHFLHTGDFNSFLGELFVTRSKIKNITNVKEIVTTIIQRGRDHGLPPYTKWRTFCKMDTANNFDDLEYEITDKTVRDKLEHLYKSVHNIDVWVGGFMEDPLPESFVGPLFRCILLKQFRNLRDGDRFWYENPSTFNPEQLQQIKKSNLGRVICDNSNDVKRVVKNPFIISGSNSTDESISCQDLPAMDLSWWKDCEQSNVGEFKSSNEKECLKATVKVLRQKLHKSLKSTT